MACDEIWINKDSLVDFSGKICNDDNCEISDIKIYPFIYKKGKIHFGKNHETHATLGTTYDIPSDDFDPSFYNDRKKWIPGRIYLDAKLISFWVYPTKEEFAEIINFIGKLFNQKVWNTGWKIEIYTGNKDANWCDVFPRNWEDYLKIFAQVPIEKYNGSMEQPKEIYLKHIQSPMDKDKEKPKGWEPKKFKYQLPDEPEVEARARVTKYKYQESIITNFKLFENPNSISLGGDNWEWDDDSEAFPFGYITTKKGNLKFLVGEEGDTHEDMAPYDSEFWGRGKLSGRVFPRFLIITFWDFPKDKSELKDIIYKIERKSGFKIWNNGYRIEVLNDLKELEYEDTYNWGSWNPSNDENTKMIPLEQYTGSRNRSPEELQQQHILSPILKKGKPEGWKPKKFKYQLPGETEVEARARVNKYVYQESLTTSFKIFENPNAIAWTNKKGNLQNIDWDVTNTTPFGYINGELCASEYCQSHAEFNDRGRNMDLSGRIWKEQKIITFWKFPEDKKELLKVVADLEMFYSIDMDDWKVEVLRKTPPTVFSQEVWGDNEDSWEPLKDDNTTYIPFGEYEGSIKRSEEEMNIQHNLPPMKKEKPIARFADWKPKKFKYQLDGETEVEARARVTKYKYQENKR